jgi:DNA polymerase-3 subunit gamma/tau
MCHIKSVIQLANQPRATDLDQDKKKTLINATGSERLKIKDQSEELKISLESPIITNQSQEQTDSLKVKTASIADLKDFIAQEDLQDLPDHLDIPLPAKVPEINKPITLPKPSTGSIKIQPLNNNTVASLIPSLTDLERIAIGEEDKGPQYVSGNEKNEFTQEKFFELWKIYTQKAKDQDKIHLFTLMNNDPILNGAEITVLVENSALESTLQDEKIELLNFLRSALKNFDLQIIIKKAENVGPKRIYTNKDKYAYMVEKNPQLEELRKRFNLDVNP